MCHLIFLEPFQSVVRPGFGSEIVLVDDPREIDRVSLLILLGILAMSDITNHGIFLKYLIEMGLDRADAVISLPH